MTKFLFSLMIELFIFSATATISNGAPGDLDPTFGNGGRVYPEIDSQAADSAGDVVIQPDGKVVVVSGWADGAIRGLSLFRFLPNGSPDATFGSSGKVYTSLSSQPGSYGQSLALQTDGKYLVVGLSCNTQLHCVVYVARYQQNGTFDPAFNGTGSLLISPILLAEDIAIQQDGKIVIVGQDPNSPTLAVARLNSDGSFDSSFGDNGKVTTSIGMSSFGKSIVLQPDSKIVVAAGTDDGTSSYHFALARYNIDGSLDTSFGSAGVAIPNVQRSGTAAIALQPDNKLIVAGGTTNGNHGVIMRFESNGSLDPSFGGSGIIYDDAAFNAKSLVVQTNGKIVLGGSGYTYTISRFLPNGARDTSFGGSGSVTTAFPDMFPPDQCIAYSGVVNAITIQRDGRIIAAGTWSANQDCDPWGYVAGEYPAIARFIGDLVPTSRVPFDFDGDGRSDVSVVRPGDSVWYLNRSSQGFLATRFGLPTDRLVPADYDGDGKTDIAIFRDGIWWWMNSSDSAIRAVQFGQAGDIPVPADYTGDGHDEVAIYRNGEWWTMNLSNGQVSAVQFGLSTDKPVPADYDGDGKADIAVFRPSDGSWWIDRSEAGLMVEQFGIATDRPVVGDYDGDGKADVAVYRDGNWYIDYSAYGPNAFQWGLASDTPVPGDYDGDGRADFAVYRDGVWYIYRSADGSIDYQYFGLSSDTPIPSAFGR